MEVKRLIQVPIKGISVYETLKLYYYDDTI